MAPWMDPATVSRTAAADDIATNPNTVKRPSFSSKDVANSKTAVPRIDDEKGTISRNGIAAPQNRHSV